MLAVDLVRVRVRVRVSLTMVDPHVPAADRVQRPEGRVAQRHPAHLDVVRVRVRAHR